MGRKRWGTALFLAGLLVSVALAGVAGWGLYHNLRTLSADELDATIWAVGSPLFMLWALSVSLGSILAMVGAFVYVKAKQVFPWLASVGILGTVVAMVIVWSRVYNSMLFGVGGMLILLSYFGTVWMWMRHYAGLDRERKVAGSLRLVGYTFWINAFWFLCGETGKLHLRAFEGDPAPSPIEIMVFLVLGWIFVLIGEYKSQRAVGEREIPAGSEAGDATSAAM